MFKKHSTNAGNESNQLALCNKMVYNYNKDSDIILCRPCYHVSFFGRKIANLVKAIGHTEFIGALVALLRQLSL